MYFVKYNPLKEQLSSRSVSDREALPYLILYSATVSLVMAFPIEGLNTWDMVSGGMSVLLAIGGIVYAYHCNGGSEGFDLIQKYVVLGWVVVIRCLLFGFPLLAVAFAVGQFAGVIEAETGLFDIVIIHVFEIILYQRIGRHIKDTRVTSQ